MVPWYLSDEFLLFCLGSIFGYAISSLRVAWNTIEPTFEIPCGMHSSTTPYQPFRAYRLTDEEARVMAEDIAMGAMTTGIRYEEDYIPSDIIRNIYARNHIGYTGAIGVTRRASYGVDPPVNEFWNKYLKSE